MKKWLALGLFAVIGTVAWAAPKLKDPVRTSRFFKVDLSQKKILGQTDYIQPALRLDLVSTTTDQPQYWPNEKVFVKVMALQRGGQALRGTWQKRDSAGHNFEARLNSDGVAVVELLDGGKQKLELGEYRVELKSEDKKTTTSTTFAVVDGALGAISFAHEWKRVTTIGELEKSDGAWFLGNPGGAGMRWGNGLSFKNEIRVANRPYNGEVTINSRCMLPGCSGTFAGRSLTRTAKDGKIEGTLEVGGHSGPFQIEVITPQGSLRYQFEGSSHVERDMMEVSGGVGWTHRVGLAPYENTVPVPGRQLYMESTRSDESAPFEAPSIVAQKGSLDVFVKKAMRHARLVVWSPNPDGSYAVRQTIDKVELSAGTKLSAPIVGPFSLVTVGGFADGKFKEGWLVGFTPSALEATVKVPESGGPNQPLVVEVAVNQGKTSGILEVFDNRVASKSAGTALASALGDSVRATSRAVSSWSDNTGLDEENDARRPAGEKEMAPSPKGSGSGYGSGAGGLSGRSAGAPPPPPMKLQAAPRAPGQPPGGGGQAPNEDDVPKDIIREGEKKVVACQLVETDAAGRARVTVKLPPQTGRVIARFVAVKGLDYAEALKTADVKLSAFADARLPRVLQRGAELKLHVDVTNNLAEAVSLLIKGSGVADEVRQIVAPGHAGADLPFAPRESGKLVLQVADKAGKAIDRRELAVDFLEDQTVTFSRLEFGGEVQVGPNEEVVVYAGAGPLLQGVAMNLFTTTESWFGHAEALSAQAAVDAVLLAAVDRGLVSDEGLGEQIRSTLNKSVRSLNEKFCDQGLCRPYPGLAPNARWSGWVSGNLHSAIRALDKVGKRDARVSEALTLSRQMAARIDAALKGHTLENGYDDNGQSVIPVEIDGKVVYRVITDDAVVRWAVDKLLPRYDFDARSVELGFARDYDSYRFLKAFERTGALPYLTDVAKALYLKGERQKFAQLYRRITRGMILIQEPGLLQGPALLGGVYSTPMAMVKFLELQLLMQSGAASQPARLGAKTLAFGERASGGGKLVLPEGAIARIDERRRLSWDGPGELGVGEPATVRTSAVHAHVGDELGLEVILSGDLDPAEYCAIIAVPSTVAVKQTEDILSDYRGQLIYGQQVTGGTRMQLLAVPFRGARSMKLVLEGAYPGHSPGKVLIRHIEKTGAAAVRAIPDVTVD